MSGRSIAVELMACTALGLMACVAPGCQSVTIPVVVEITSPVGALDVEGTEHPRVEYVSMRSELLSNFWGREMRMEAAVIVPPGFEVFEGEAAEDLPVCYFIHGFGGSHRGALRGRNLAVARDPEAGYPRILTVALNSTFPLGHHIWADSANNGPWGAALTEEFIPAIEAAYGAAGVSEGRFLAGGSSGAHAALWLQVAYPDFFGGVWAGAPDPVDFRDFTGINIYADANAYTYEAGDERMLVRRDDEWTASIREYVRREVEGPGYGGQYASFDAVFSPRAEDGRPMPLFDRETGAIDPFVAEAWKAYDLSIILRENWDRLGPKLRGKLRIYCGTKDSFRLDGAVRLLEAELKRLGSDAEIVWAEGWGHGVFRAHAELWPKGLLDRVQREMAAEYARTR